MGCPELWIDEAALDRYARGDAAPAVTVSRRHAAHSHVGAAIGFEAGCDLGDGKVLGSRVVYQVVSRRWDTAVNGGRPYYVCTWPD